MMNFTPTSFKKFGLSVVALLLCLSSSVLLQAQTSYTVTVNTPASIAGNYASLVTAFGSNPCSISGELILADDGVAPGTDACSAITNDLTGKIAVVDRGVCSFAIKVLNAQKKGAIAVIIVNNSSAAIISGAASPPQSDSVTIPAFMISLADGNKIKPEIANGATVTISQTGAVPPSAGAEPIVWGTNPGEGDFNGGLNGWTTNTLSCSGTGTDYDLWQWNASGDIRGACGDAYIFSPTRCNGAVVLESDFADSNGEECGVVGVGPCPSPHAAELVSPVIDLSGSTSSEDFILRYYQATREFDASYYVAWTIDGGVTWDTTEVNTDLDETAPVPSIQRVTLEGTQGADNLQVKFIFDGDYYYWAIDDVQITELANNNLSIDTNPFFAVAQNYATPLAHVEPIAFLSDIHNIGAKEQYNVNLNSTVYYRPTSTSNYMEVFSTDRSYGTVPAGASIENLPFVETYTPTAIGQYVIEYHITSDSTDSDEDNDYQDAPFLVTQNLFSKDAVPNQAFRPSDTNWEGNEPHSWAWGNYYYIPESADNYVQTVTFGFSTTGPVAGREALVTLYEWVDENMDEQADPEERIPVAFATYTFTGTETATNLVTIPFPGPEEEPVQLKDSTAYLIMFEYYADDQANFFMSSSNAIDYGAMNLVNDSIGRPRYAGFLGIKGDLSIEPYSSLGFGYDIVPSVRMTVGATPSSAKDLSKLESEFVVFPNPASDAVNVQLNLSKQAQTATVRLFDLSGKMIQQFNYDNVQKEKFQYNVSRLSSGTYFLQVITEEGAGTKKFTVAK